MTEVSNIGDKTMGSDTIYNDLFENGQPDISYKDYTTDCIVRLGELYDVRKEGTILSGSTDHKAAVTVKAEDDKLWGENVEMQKSVALKFAILKVLENHGKELYDQYQEVLSNIDYYYTGS